MQQSPGTSRQHTTARARQPCDRLRVCPGRPSHLFAVWTLKVSIVSEIYGYDVKVTPLGLVQPAEQGGENGGCDVRETGMWEPHVACPVADRVCTLG